VKCVFYDLENTLSCKSQLCLDQTTIFESMIKYLKKDVQVFLIDYIQLLIDPRKLDKCFLGLPANLKNLITLFKRFSVEWGVCIFFTSKISMEVDLRVGHLPSLLDFKEDGCIEETCDVVLLLRRREFYDSMDNPGIAEFIVGKNRFGKTGSFDLTFHEGNFYEYEKICSKVNLFSEEAFALFSQFTPL